MISLPSSFVIGSRSPRSALALSAAAIALATGLPVAPALAQCNISRTGTPDFDQRRLIELPNDGRMYCAPTAVANGLALLANSGFPEAFSVQSGGINWQNPGLHNMVSQRINQLGNLMSTDAFNGTNLDSARIGAQQWLDQRSPGNFVVTSHHAFENYTPNPFDMYKAQKAGAIVTPIWGRYTFDGVGFTRNGGHVITMTALQDACGNTPRMYWRNPDDAGTNPDMSQSLFTSQTAFLNFANGPYRPTAGSPYTPGALFRFSNSTNRVLDGFIVIKPLTFGTLGQGPGEIASNNPVQPTGLLLPAVQKFQVPSDGQAHDLALDSRLNRYYISTQAAAGNVEATWKVEEGEAAVPLMENDGPALLATGRSGQLYIADGRTLTAMNVWAEPATTIGSILLPHTADAVAYDDNTDSLLALSTAQRTVMVVDRDLTGAAGGIPMLTIPSQVPLGADASMVMNTSGNLLLASAASSSIFILSPGRGAAWVLTDVIVSSAVEPPQGLQTDSRGNIFCIRAGIIEEFEKDPATGNWIPAANSILAGKPAHKRLALATSRTNFNPATMSGPEYREISPDDQPGIPDCYANCDLSTIAPVLNVDDFTCFINSFAAAQSLTTEAQILHYANCDNSEVSPILNVDDFTCFINQFAQGCPR